MRPLSAISDRSLRSLDRNDLLVSRSRTSTSQQRAFASAGPLLWNCPPVKSVLNDCSYALWLVFHYSSPSQVVIVISKFLKRYSKAKRTRYQLIHERWLIRGR